MIPTIRLHPVAVVLFCLAVATKMFPACSAEMSDAPVPIQRAQAVVRIGEEQITLPGSEPTGMLGTSYLIEVSPHFYLGPVAYSALTGQRGGFYTAGGELAWNPKWDSQLQLFTGAYLGGGGGSPTMVGGGLMLRPHADLLWNFGGYRAGMSVSSVLFPNGNIASNQFGLIADLDAEFRYTDFNFMGKQSAIKDRSGVGFDRALVAAGFYRPSQQSTDLGGKPLQHAIAFVGSRMEQRLTQNYFWGLEAAGAVSGGVAGYAEFLATAGAEIPVWEEDLSVGSRVALGTGGGGYVMNTGGGVLVKAGVFATARLSKNAHASIEGGVASAPTGNFRATYNLFALHWDLDQPFITSDAGQFVGNEWSAGSQHYFQAARKDGSRQDMDSLTLKMNRFLSESIYLTGQAHSAYSGYAGGYSVGLVGLGLRTPKSSWGGLAGIELLAGAGAGGWVDSSGGAVVQPMLYLAQAVSPSVLVRLGAGQVKSIRGGLNSQLLDIGVSFAFGSGSRE